jgi:hypothetical protein
VVYKYKRYSFDACKQFVVSFTLRRVRRYQSGNQNPKIEEGQTTQWPKEKGQRDKQQ